MNQLVIVLAGLTALAFVGCQAGEPREYGDTRGVEEVAQPLADLSSQVTWDGGTGALTVKVNDADVAVISKHAVTGAILVNDIATSATSTSLKYLAVYDGASPGDATVILDFANGSFAPGTASGPGIVVNLNNATTTDAFKFRGQSATADTLQVGGSATDLRISTGTDTNYDIKVIGTATKISHTFSLGGGADTFNATGTSYGVGSTCSVDVTVYGGTGSDVLTGGSGNDTLYGDSGDDTLSGGSANNDSDALYGGSEADAGTGQDTVTYAARTTALTIVVGPLPLSTATASSGEATETDDIKNDVEIVQGGSAADAFTGAAGAQTFYGNAGNDTFDMGTLAGTGAGADVVYGGAGTDTVDYTNRVAGITVTMDGTAANDGDTASNEKDNIQADVENLIAPVAAVANSITGNALDNKITGGAGADTVVGGAGDDTFILLDTAAGGAGADNFTGGAGVDTVDFRLFNAAATITMNGLATGNTQSKIISTDTENFLCDITASTPAVCTVTGNAGNNHIVGGGGADVIKGLGGDDTIEAGAGGSDIDCGDGSDIFISGGGTDTVAACEL